ncbi:hypothetical protein [Shewanella woodyi]|uniref:hypothetical protein n=1 Tax=Shewanella woodyi TaxID=60961 RepID=UPI0002D82EF0|nr:hypothetical protein [Shewanella woodyi]
MSFEGRTSSQNIVEAVVNTNQYKDLIAQREFSGTEARQRVKSIVILRLSSLTQYQNR